MVRLAGVEPATSGATNLRSNQLSYNRTCKPPRRLFGSNTSIGLVLQAPIRKEGPGFFAAGPSNSRCWKSGRLEGRHGLFGSFLARLADCFCELARGILDAASLIDGQFGLLADEARL